MSETSVGVAPVKKEERILKFNDLFFIWGAGQVLPTGFLTGGAIGAGISALSALWVSIASVIIGYLPLAYQGLPSAKYGIDQYVACRPAFGIRGSWLGSLLILITNAGWVSVMAVVCGASADIVYQHYFPGQSAALFFSIVGGIVIPLLIGIWGPNVIRLVEKAVAPVLLILSAVIMFAAIRAAGGWSGLMAIPPQGEGSIALSMEYGIAYAISWCPYVGAWTMLAKSEKAASWGTFLGLALVGSWFYLTGAVSAIYTGNADPTSWMIPLGLGIPALICLMGGVMAVNSLLTYSASSGLAQWIPYFAGRYKLSYVVAILPALPFIIWSQLVTEYGAWLAIIGALWGPFFGIFIIDYFFIRNQRYNIKEIFTKKGDYWYWGGFNIFAIAIWLIGVKIYYMILDGPIFSYITATLPAMAITGLIYFVVAKVILKKIGKGGY